MLPQSTPQSTPRVRRVWAPDATGVRCVLGAQDHPPLAELEMAPAPGGWWVLELEDPLTWADYGFRLDGGPDVLPDPRSPRQPHGVHGRSRPVDHAAFAWMDAGWRGAELAGSILYELHVGTFSAEGTFAAAAAHLEHLVALGIDYVELLPVHAFPGRWGWGYDPAALFAVHEPYGGPDGLKAFVDACHARGLGVVLDVVYNHLGPDGNVLARFGPYFTDRHTTNWGPAVNLDAPGSDEVRAFLVDNALSWLRDYHVDGLRLDAVHAFADSTARPFLTELVDAVAQLAAAEHRPLFVVGESDLNDPRLVLAREAGGYGLAAVWSDDFHHGMHVALTGERDGYYVDFAGLTDVATALRRAYVYRGQHSVYRGRRHGAPVPPQVPGARFVGYLQNHDQVGNRATGDRLSARCHPELLAVAAAVLLMAPFTPLLFMGEEWGASTPWRYFTDHTDPELAEAVRSGRRAEFAAFGWDPDAVPDPQDPTTRDASVLDWRELTRPPHAHLLSWYRRLVTIRRSYPELSGGTLAQVQTAVEADAGWLVLRRGRVVLGANFAQAPRDLPIPPAGIQVLAVSTDGVQPLGHELRLPPRCAIVLEVPDEPAPQSFPTEAAPGPATAGPATAGPSAPGPSAPGPAAPGPAPSEEAVSRHAPPG